MPKISNTFDALSFRYFLLDNYKKLGIEENELCVLLMCDHLIHEGNKFITADLLRLKMNFHTSEIDKILVSLINKKMIEFVPKDDGMITSLEPLRSRLYKLFQIEILKDRSSFESKERKEAIETLIKFYELKLGRKLSPLETDTMSSWLDDEYTIKEIQDALSLTLKSRKKSFRAIDSTLKNIRSRDDYSKEGYSAVGKDSWNKNIEKTIEIAKTNWLDNDK